MVIFYEFEGKCFRQVCSDENAIWIVDYDTPSAPREISQEGLCQLKPIPVPESYLDESDIIGKRRLRMEKRLEMLELMIADNNCITDKKYRHCLAQMLSGKYGISIKTIYRLYYAYLAKGERGLAPAARVVQENETTDKNNIAQALSRYFYSPRKMSRGPRITALAFGTTYNIILDKIRKQQAVLNPAPLTDKCRKLFTKLAANPAQA